MKFEARIHADQVIHALLRAPKTVGRHLVRALDRSAHELARTAKRGAPKAFSTTANSIQVLRESDFSRVIAPQTDYAGAVEHGTGLFGPEGLPSGKMPPVQSLIDWIRVKRIEPDNGLMDEEDLAFLIGQAIARRGTPAQPFMRPALEATESRFQQLVRDGVAQGLKEVAAQ